MCVYVCMYVCVKVHLCVCSPCCYSPCCHQCLEGVVSSTPARFPGNSGFHKSADSLVLVCPFLTQHFVPLSRRACLARPHPLLCEQRTCSVYWLCVKKRWTQHYCPSPFSRWKELRQQHHCSPLYWRRPLWPSMWLSNSHSQIPFHLWCGPWQNPIPNNWSPINF